MPQIVVDVVHQVVRMVSCGELDQVVAATPSRGSAGDLRGVISEYGRRFVAPPFEGLDVVKITQGAPDVWSVYAPLDSIEEGRSDLTLQLTVRLRDGRVVVEIDGLRVL